MTTGWWEDECDGWEDRWCEGVLTIPESFELALLRQLPLWAVFIGLADCLQLLKEERENPDLFWIIDSLKSSTFEIKLELTTLCESKGCKTSLLLQPLPASARFSSEDKQLPILLFLLSTYSFKSQVTPLP